MGKSFKKVGKKSICGQIVTPYFMDDEHIKVLINMIWHITSDKETEVFFCLSKKTPKICKIQDPQKCQPMLNLESDIMGHLVFMGQSNSELFSLPK